MFIPIEESKKEEKKETFNENQPIGTTCIIKKNDQIVSEGFAHKSKKDLFNKEVGRRLSLERAVNNPDASIEMDKELRTEIWNIYNEREVEVPVN